jgi:polar amino acid transport system substrate-binding protein
MKLKLPLASALFSAALAVLAPLLATSIAFADTLDDIKARGKVIVAIDPTFAPYEFTDSSGKIVGYTPAIMEAVAKKIGVILEYQKMAFNGIIPGLLAKSFDLEGSSLNVTAERAKRVSFTVPFGKSANGVLARAGESRVPATATVESLAGLTAVVKAATAPEKLLKEFNATLAGKGLAPIQIVSLDTVEQTITALLAKRGDFVFDDITVLGAAMQQNPGKLRSAGELGAAQWMAWATRPDDTRLNKLISEVILGMQKSGELSALQKKHLGVTIVVPEADFIPKP